MLLSGAMMTFILELQVRAESGSMTLQQSGSLLMSVTILTIDVQVDAPGAGLLPGDTLALCQTVSEAMPIWVNCKARPKLLPGTIQI